MRHITARIRTQKRRMYTDRTIGKFEEYRICVIYGPIVLYGLYERTHFDGRGSKV